MILERERNKYRKMWDQEEYRGFSPGEHIVGIAHSMFKKYGAVGSLIDFGCGTGRASDRFKQLGYEVTMVDFASNAVEVEGIDFIESCLWSLPSHLKADNGFCSDVMEHIPTEMVGRTLDCIHKATTDLMLFQIALTPDSCGQLIGETLHLTLWSESQWRKELNTRWTELHSETNGYNLLYLGRSNH